MTPIGTRLCAGYVIIISGSPTMSLIFTREGRSQYFDGQGTTAVSQERVH